MTIRLQNVDDILEAEQVHFARIVITQRYGRERDSADTQQVSTYTSGPTDLPESIRPLPQPL